MRQDVEDKYAQYPEHVKLVLLDVRTLIFDLADEHQLGEVEENLKWGQLSYLVKGAALSVLVGVSISRRNFQFL